MTNNKEEYFSKFEVKGMTTIDDIIKNLNVLAAETARRNGMPSPFLENHPKRMTRRYVEGEFEKVDDKCGEWASRLGELTRQLRKRSGKEPGEAGESGRERCR